MAVIELTRPEEIQDLLSREFGDRIKVSLYPSHQQGVEAVLLIVAPEEIKYQVQARAAELCARLHDMTRHYIIPVLLPESE